MVTAELAVSLPALVLVLMVALNALVIGVDQVRCTDAARVAGRAAARGDSVAGVRAMGLGHAPEGSRVGVADGGTTIAVTVTSPVRGPFAWLTGGRQLTATVHAQPEVADTS